MVRFEADALDASLPPSTVPDLVADVRAGDTANTLMVDFGPRFASFRTTDSPGDRGVGRLVIDVAAQTTDTAPGTATPAPAPPAAPELPPLLDLAPSGSLRTIVIDAGHGGDDDGARGPGGTMTAAFAPATPPPMTVTRAERVPGTPDMSRPSPPAERIRVAAPTVGASRPATSDIGASSGSPPPASCTVSYAIAVTRSATSRSVSGRSAARCRYVKSTRSSRK